MTDLRQAAQQALEALENHEGNYKLTDAGCKRVDDAIAALSEALEQPEQWDKPAASFNAWWDSDHADPANPFVEGTAAYWAWAGWKAAQRPWQGLTDDEIKATWSQLWYDLNHGKLSAPDNEVRNNVVMFGQTLEAKLKERNT